MSYGATGAEADAVGAVARWRFRAAGQGGGRVNRNSRKEAQKAQK